METSDWIILVVAVAVLALAVLLVRIVSKVMIEAHFERKVREREAERARRRAVRERLLRDEDDR